MLPVHPLWICNFSFNARQIWMRQLPGLLSVKVMMIRRVSNFDGSFADSSSLVDACFSLVCPDILRFSFPRLRLSAPISHRTSAPSLPCSQFSCRPTLHSQLSWLSLRFFPFHFLLFPLLHRKPQPLSGFLAVSVLFHILSPVFFFSSRRPLSSLGFSFLMFPFQFAAAKKKPPTYALVSPPFYMELPIPKPSPQW